MSAAKVSHLLDTSVYSQRLRPKPLADVVKRWMRLGDSALAVSAICESELLYGLSRKDSKRLWLEYRQFLEDRLTILPVDKPVAALYGALKASLEAKGTPRADFDLLIAATAIHHRLVLATINVRHFSGIPGLKVEDWSIDGIASDL